MHFKPNAITRVNIKSRGSPIRKLLLGYRQMQTV